MGAPESNAGDAFHFWWAASRALVLVEPGSGLRRIAIEGLAFHDDPNDAYETVDLAEYYGGEDVASATAVVLSQLKHSTRHPEAAWTTARLCQQRRRRNSASLRSVVADLARAFRRLINDHGEDTAAKTSVALVSNQPADPALVSAVTTAAAWVRAQQGPVQRAGMLQALPEPHRSTVEAIAAAVGSGLRSSEFCAFIAALDLTNLGTLGHSALARAVRVGATELSPDLGPDSARRLFHLVQEEALPGRGRGGLRVSDVLAELGAPEIADLYPAPPRLPDVQDPLPAPAARVIADAAKAAAGRSMVVAHGPAGAGKTTALRQLPEHLPPGSVTVLFDCYGGGDYLSSGEERHTPQRFVVQVVNELAQRCGTPLLVKPHMLEPDLWRRLSRTLEHAAATLEPGALLVLAVDAADNAVVAAEERGDRGFIPSLTHLPLPAGVAVVVTARSHRVPMLGAAGAAIVEIAPFDPVASAAHLRRYRQAATDSEAEEFHARTGGNPRAQFYALAQAAQTGASTLSLLDACHRTPMPVFEDLVESALRVSGTAAGGERWLGAMLALSRPVSTDTLAAVLQVNPAAVAAFAAGLDPGVKVADGAIQFRDEDFETYVRGRVDPSAVTAAHNGLATIFLATRTHDPDAAAHVADHLFAADRLDELLQLVLAEDSPAGIDDGFRREQVQARRLDLAARAAAVTGDAAAAVRVAARGCDTASRLETLSRLVESNLDLVARYADIKLLRSHALRQTRHDWLGPVLMRLAAALSRDPARHADARAELDRADGWLRRWTAGHDDKTRHWDVEPDDVAAAAEARYRLDGVDAAMDELRRWQPPEFVLDAAAALADRLGTDLPANEAREALRDHAFPLAAQAPVLARIAAAGGPVDSAWVDEVAASLVADPVGEPSPWHADMVDAAARHGDPVTAAALARHLAHDLPASRWSFSGSRSVGTATLRCHAAVAVLTGEKLDAGALVPPSLRQKTLPNGHVDDQRAHERREWSDIVSPLAAAAVLAARAAAGESTTGDVEAFAEAGLAPRIDRSTHRWFTYDQSYRTWAVLVAEAAVDTGAAPALLDRLADAAGLLLRDGAPEVWLELASTISRRGAYPDRAADLCVRAARMAREQPYSASDRLDLLARAAVLAAPLDRELGRHLFEFAVEAATGINDDAASLLSVHADLGCHAQVPAHERPGMAARLVAAIEAVAPHVSDSGFIPYAAIAGATARLHAPTGLAAASRWDDEDRTPLATTLPSALARAVEGGGLPAWQALRLDHLVEGDGRRLAYQLDIVEQFADAGAAGRAAARVAVARAANWLRLRVPAREQPALAGRLLDWAAARDLDAHIRPVLEPVRTLTVADSAAARRDWSGGDPPPHLQALLDGAATRPFRALADDVAALHEAHIYGDQFGEFITTVALAAAPAERVEALGAVAALSDRHPSHALDALASCLGAWRGWPRVASWARDELPHLLADGLAELAWRSDTGALAAELRLFDDADSIRRAVLRALPQARPQLTAHGWQNIAALLGRLCPPADAATALQGLLDDRVPAGALPSAADDSGAAGPVPSLLWSAFGHPRRAIRWRAAHAVRELLAHPDAATGPLVGALISCLERDGSDRYRDPALHFYRLSAAAALLVALSRAAQDQPTLFARYLPEFVRHATSATLPHAQIRELARQTALAVAAPGDPAVQALQAANRPDRCHAGRDRVRNRNDRVVSDDRRYDFDGMDTIPYWYAPLAGVFDVPVDMVAKLAENWILDRWGLDRDDWMRDARELRDQRSWQRMSHRHGSIPPEESLQRYVEYHAMMAAAGECVDASKPMRVGAWDDDSPWQQWLAPHLPLLGTWLADLGVPVPAEADFFGAVAPIDDAWDAPAVADHDRALGLVDGGLPEQVIVAGSTTLRRPGGREHVYIASALAAPDHAGDLQRALSTASNPSDWKLPDEGEDEFEVDFGDYQLHGWIANPRDHRDTLDEHDPYAQGMRPALPLPGTRFRETARAAPDAAGLALVGTNGARVAVAEQWADPDAEVDTSREIASSGHRVRVDRGALLRHLAATGTTLIVEVQLGRHRTDARSGDYRPPQSRVYLVDAAGRVPGS